MGIKFRTSNGKTEYILSPIPKPFIYIYSPQEPKITRKEIMVRLGWKPKDLVDFIEELKANNMWIEFADEHLECCHIIEQLVRLETVYNTKE